MSEAIPFTDEELKGLRSQFPMLKKRVHEKPLIYLDSAATALTPASVIESLRRFYAEEYGTVHRAVYELAQLSTERFHAVRKKVAQFIGADAEEIIFTKGATEGLNLLATSLGHFCLNMKDEVLISEIEHHANIVPWQMVCHRRGARLRAIPVNDRGELILDLLQEMITSHVKIVSIAHLSNAIGTLHPIREIAEIVHEAGALLVVDGAQAIAHLPVDVRELGADFYVFSGHKLFGPTGIGVLYGRRELLEELPPYQGGGDMVERVTLDESTYQSIPLRFEAGTPNIGGAMGLGAAIDFVEECGRDRIHAHGQRLVRHALEKLASLPGFHPLGMPKERGPIISFTIEGAHPLDIGTLLDLKGGVAIRTGHHCAQTAMQRFGQRTSARFSMALYNTIEEIDQAVEVLKEVLSTLKRAV